MLKKANISHGKDEQDGEEGRVTLRSSIKVAV
jgi:hypothetical protein